MKNSALRNFVLGGLLCATSMLGHAAWPSDDKPVKILVPWPAGGATDQVARLIAQPLSQALGVLKPLAVASSKRLPVLPQVPTFNEAGVPMLASAWYGLVLPAGASDEVVNRLNTEVNRILKQPEISSKLTGMGAFVMGGTSSEFGRFVNAEIKRYEVIVRESGAPKE